MKGDLDESRKKDGVPAPTTYLRREGGVAGHYPHTINNTCSPFGGQDLLEGVGGVNPHITLPEAVLKVDLHGHNSVTNPPSHTCMVSGVYRTNPPPHTCMVSGCVQDQPPTPYLYGVWCVQD